MFGSWHAWQRKMLCGLAVCMCVAVVLSLFLICIPGSATWTIGTAHALWLKAFAREHQAVFCGNLRVTVPAGWECDAKGCYYYGLADKPVSYVFFSTASLEDKAGQSAVAQSVRTASVLVGGVRAETNLTTVPFGPGFLATTTVVDDKDVKIDFLGRQQDWELWKGVLGRAVWLKQRVGAT